MDILGGWDVRVQYAWHRMAYEIMLVRRLNNKATEYLQLQQSQPVSVVTVMDGEWNESLLPTLRIDEFTACNLVTALQTVGVKPKDATKLEGVLEAQTLHLSDLQKVLRKQGVME